MTSSTVLTFALRVRKGWKGFRRAAPAASRKAQPRWTALEVSVAQLSARPIIYELLRDALLFDQPRRCGAAKRVRAAYVSPRNHAFGRNSKSLKQRLHARVAKRLNKAAETAWTHHSTPSKQPFFTPPATPRRRQGNL